MPASPIDPHSASPADLRERIRADGLGGSYLLFRDGEGQQRIVALRAERMTVGRAPGCELSLSWDEKVSGTHAQLERIGGSDWTLTDDGLSRNGSFVNGERVRQRRRLADGDLLQFGDTAILFRAPPQEISETVPAIGEPLRVQLTPAQRRVLVALCRPFRDDDDFATPASNQQIADELVVSVEAVKTHLRALFEKFDVGSLPRQAKRTQLVKRAFAVGAISPRDLDP